MYAVNITGDYNVQRVKESVASSVGSAGASVGLTASTELERLSTKGTLMTQTENKTTFTTSRQE